MTAAFASIFTTIGLLLETFATLFRAANIVAGVAEKAAESFALRSQIEIASATKKLLAETGISLEDLK